LQALSWTSTGNLVWKARLEGQSRKGPSVQTKDTQVPSRGKTGSGEEEMNNKTTHYESRPGIRSKEQEKAGTARKKE